MCSCIVLLTTLGKSNIILIVIFLDSTQNIFSFVKILLHYKNHKKPTRFFYMEDAKGGTSEWNQRLSTWSAWKQGGDYLHKPFPVEESMRNYPRTFCYKAFKAGALSKITLTFGTHITKLEMLGCGQAGDRRMLYQSVYRRKFAIFTEAWCELVSELNLSMFQRCHNTW